MVPIAVLALLPFLGCVVFFQGLIFGIILRSGEARVQVKVAAAFVLMQVFLSCKLFKFLLIEIRIFHIFKPPLIEDWLIEFVPPLLWESLSEISEKLVLLLPVQFFQLAV